MLPTDPRLNVQKEAVFRVEKADLNQDLSAIASVVNSAYKKVVYLKDDGKTSPADLKDIISNPSKALYLCLSTNNEICGTILIQYDANRKKAELGMFAIHPRYQGANIGAIFANCVEKEIFKVVPEIILKVVPLEQAKLVKFYINLGYQFTGEKVPFSEEETSKYIHPEYRDKVFMLIMSKKLHSNL